MFRSLCLTVLIAQLLPTSADAASPLRGSFTARFGSIVSRARNTYKRISRAAAPRLESLSNALDDSPALRATTRLGLSAAGGAAIFTGVQQILSGDMVSGGMLIGGGTKAFLAALTLHHVSAPMGPKMVKHIKQLPMALLAGGLLGGGFELGEFTNIVGTTALATGAGAGIVSLGSTLANNND